VSIDQPTLILQSSIRSFAKETKDRADRGRQTTIGPLRVVYEEWKFTATGGEGEFTSSGWEFTGSGWECTDYVFSRRFG
jgi:hypothetical protein